MPAFTLTELMLALVITTLIGGAVATMLFSAFRGTSDQEDRRELMINNTTAGLRLNAALRSSAMVLAKGANFLVLWMDDTSSPYGFPQLSELRRIERNPSTNELWSYKAPPDLAEEDDAQYNLAATDFAAVTAALKGSATFPGELWARDVTGWTSYVNANPRQSAVVEYQMITTLKGISETSVAATALRNH